MLVSLCYVLVRWLPEFVALRARSKEFKELEIIVLRHELAILRRTTRHPAMTAVDRVLSRRVRAGLLPRVQLAIFHRHAGDAVALASMPGRQAVDVRPRPSVVRRCGVRFESWCCGSRARTGGVAPRKRGRGGTS